MRKWERIWRDLQAQSSRPIVVARPTSLAALRRLERMHAKGMLKWAHRNSWWASEA